MNPVEPPLLPASAPDNAAALPLGSAVGCSPHVRSTALTPGGQRALEQRLLLLLSFPAATACALMLFVFDPSQYAFYPRCLFHSLTGLLCPGCGCLRAAHELLHFRFEAAWNLNPLLLGSLPFGALLAFRKVFASGDNDKPAPANRTWLWICLVVVVGFGIWRNLPWKPAGWLH